jgi:DNA polymerase III subunit alpha
MSTEFVHLHLHSDYSLLDGACAIYRKDERSDIVKLAKKYGMHSVAITDHGVMGGAMEFYQSLNANALKPIIGCEMYVSPTTMDDRDPQVPNIKGYHLVLLAKDLVGYRNLCELNSAAHLRGMYYKPRVDKKLLAEKSEGIIALSACLAGEIPQFTLKGKHKQAKDAILEYQDIFGKENFYLEIMDHGMDEQKKVNKEVVQLSKEFNIPLVATNDAHYLEKEHAKSHDLMLCIQTNATVNDEKRFSFSSNELYFKSGDEMLELFKEVPESLKNTLEVAEKCNLTIPMVPEVNHYPVYEINDGTNEKEYLRNICLDSMQDRYGFDPRKVEKLSPEQEKIIKRMDYELDTIDGSKYCSYFLVVWDFLKYARDTKVPIGPGRGSGAGSIVAYLTYITDIEPLRYQLLFERFLNPERVSPPDFDIDFCERRRSEVIDYVRHKYGKDSVAQIGTYGTLKAKAVIKDVGRALGYSFDQRNAITKIMSSEPKATLMSELENNLELQEMIKKETWVEEIFKYSKPLEGLNRHMSMHAAGVIIGDQPLDKLVPLSKGAENEAITQFPAVPCEDLGLLKMDFLGLKTLTIIQDAVDHIETTTGKVIDISKISLEDKNAYDLLNRGDTVAVFQLESGGMQELCKRFGVDRIEDIIALIALYRPGPMQFIGDFIDRKTGKVKVEYDDPKMEAVLNETYGIMLYQEQIMQVVQVLGGFTLGGADILRRAIGKKKADVLAEQKEKFVKGCKEFSNIEEKVANNIWDKIEMFAGYGFNKSHSAAYAFLSYRTAYLKANYPVEFMTAVLTSELKNAEKMSFFIRECKEMQIDIFPPDINSSNLNFTIDNGCIRFGLAAIKGVGEAAATAIIESRNKDGKFKNLMDFGERLGNSVSSRVLENLILTGAFDSFGYKRSQLREIIGDFMTLAQAKAKDRLAGQGNLFDFFEPTDEEEKANGLDIKIPDIPEMHEQELLQHEKDLLGFYVSGHPLGKYSDLIKTYSTHSVLDMYEITSSRYVKSGGIISGLQLKNTKRGDRFAIFNLEDLDSNIECLVFPKAYENVKSLIVENKPIFVTGTVNRKDDDENATNKLIAEDIVEVEKVYELFTKEIHIRLHEASNNSKTLERVKKELSENPGEALSILCVTCTGGEIAYIEAGEEFNVRVTDELIHKLKNIVGEEAVHLKPDLSVPQFKEKRYRKRD